jgi:hypothetical protein
LLFLDGPLETAAMLKNYLFIFGAVILAAGVQGLLAGSVISIVAAGVLGGLVLAGAFMLGTKTTLALILALVGALGIAGRFLPVFLKAPDKAAALWPAGVLAILGVISLVLTVQALVKK